MTTIIIDSAATLHRPLYRLGAFNRKASEFACVSYTAPADRCIRPISFSASAQTCVHIETARRSGNYRPPLWNFDYIQSSSSEYEDRKYSARASEFVKQVKKMLDEGMESIRQLEMIDDLQRLGISYLFEGEINQILRHIYMNKYCRNYMVEKRFLYSTALEFRLLREHGFNVIQDVFDCFKNKAGDFDPSLAHDDTKGLLQLYEASFLLTQGEQTLELAREFATCSLREKLKQGFLGANEYLSLLVRNALELPLHWRIRWPNARWFIEAYSKKPDMNHVLLELAKLHFNIVQATHLQELKHVSMWWKQTGLAESLPFARDRVVENYFWTLGGLYQPQYQYVRIQGTKVNSFITIIDDIFDVYGTLEELKLFTEAIQRWDIEGIEKLPDYMKICYLALNNFINEIAYDVLKEQGHVIIGHLRRSWADLCKSYLQEAEWFSTGYMPKMEEYLSNAWVSISATTILSHVFFLACKPTEREATQNFYKYHPIVVCSSMLLRLANDMGTSWDEMARGDVPKSIECYMKEKGASREEAREHVRHLIGETWKRMNEEVSLVKVSQKLPDIFVRGAMDLGRMAQLMYEHGDGHGTQNDGHIKTRISTMLFHPIDL